jgi:glycerol uptake facilitator-like aquaporin
MGSFFCFVVVIAQTALDKRGIATSSLPPLAIGLSLVVAHCGLIPLTGCGLNPARTFGPSMIVCMSGKDNCDVVTKDVGYWIYYIAPFSAASVVAEDTHWLNMEDEKS